MTYQEINGKNEAEKKAEVKQIRIVFVEDDFIVAQKLVEKMNEYLTSNNMHCYTDSSKNRRKIDFCLNGIYLNYTQTNAMIDEVEEYNEDIKKKIKIVCTENKEFVKNINTWNYEDLIRDNNTIYICDTVIFSGYSNYSEQPIYQYGKDKGNFIFYTRHVPNNKYKKIMKDAKIISFDDLTNLNSEKFKVIEEAVKTLDETQKKN